MELNMIHSILGLIGGLLCACGDMLLDLKGKDNQELGTHGFINSSWVHMAGWRFRTSILCVTVGVPCYILGGISLGNQIGVSNSILGEILKYSVIIGGVGGYFIHVILCLMPLIYKTIDNFEMSNNVMNTIWDAIKLPFIVFYLILVGVSSVVVAWAIIAGDLKVPVGMAATVPFILLLIGVTLRKLKHQWFYDLPGIIMPSMGLAMYGVIGIMNLLG